MTALDFLEPSDVDLPRVESTATKMLQHFVVDDTGMFRPPVDPNKIAKALGVDVREISLPEKISGFIAKESKDLPAVIYINENHGHVRQRFTVAHELGHYIQETARGNKTFETLRRETGHADQGIHEQERWANGLAAGVLMPAGPTRRLYVEGESVQEIANRFKVSTKAMEYRLANLGLS